MSEEDRTAADEVIEEVREVRRRLWARHGGDPAKYAAYLQEFYDKLVREGWRGAPVSEQPAGRGAGVPPASQGRDKSAA